MVSWESRSLIHPVDQGLQARQHGIPCIVMVLVGWSSSGTVE